MSGVRSILRRCRAELGERSGRHATQRARLDGTRAAILTYHRVLPAHEAARLAVEPGMFVTPATFASQLAWLVDAFRVLPLGELVERLEAGRSLPPGAVALSFDDGWRDNLEHALPALERHGLPATLFVVTGRVGTPGAFWPDRICRLLGGLAPARARALRDEFAPDGPRDPAEAILDVLKRCDEAARPDRIEALAARARTLGAGEPAVERELLDWDELDRLAAGGFAIESHGASHALLTRCADPAAELRDARRTLAERGHGSAGLLAYPSGDHDPRVRAVARETGYRAAVTTDPGLAAVGGDPFAVPRIGIHDDVSRSRAEFRERVPGSAR